MTRRKELHATACAQRETDLAVAVAGVAREAEHAGEERSDAIAAEFLEPAAEPVIDRRARDCHRAVLCRLNGEVGLLVAEEALDLEAIRPMERDVDDGAERRRAVEIDGLLGDELEELTAEPVAAERRDLDGLRARRRRSAERAGQDRDHRDERRPARCAHGPALPAGR